MSETIETTNTEAKQSVPAEVANAPRRGGSLWVILVILLVVIGVGVAYTQGVFSGDDNGSEGEEQVSVDPDAVVATVNGTTITRGELTDKLEQVKNTVPAGAIDPTTDPEFEAVLLDELINVTLLTLLAEERGFAASDEDIDREIATLTEMFGGEEAFNQQLESTGITNEELRENMRNEIVIRMLINEDTDIENVAVSDEEVKVAYDAIVVAAPDTVPPFDQVQELLYTQLLQDKSSAIVDAYIATALEGADIDIAL